VKPVVTEVQLHRLVWPVCGEATRAAVPAGVPSGGFGARVQAITALCTGAYHLSKRATQSLLEDLFGVGMSLGTLANLEQVSVQAVAEAVAQARAYVPQQPVAYLDETGWREGSQRAGCGRRSLQHGLCGAALARWPDGPGPLGGAVLGMVGHRPLEWVQLVSAVAPAAVLGAFVARYRGHDRARWALADDWRGLAGAPDVSLVASGA
jgi:hypothetical protein